MSDEVWIELMNTANWAIIGALITAVLYFLKKRDKKLDKVDDDIDKKIEKAFEDYKESQEKENILKDKNLSLTIENAINLGNKPLIEFINKISDKLSLNEHELNDIPNKIESAIIKHKMEDHQKEV